MARGTAIKRITFKGGNNFITSYLQNHISVLNKVNSLISLSREK